MSAEAARVYDNYYEQFMVPAGELPQTSGNQEAEALHDWESDGFNTPQDNPYYLCADVIKYNGRWYNWQLGGHLAELLNLDYRLNGIAPLESLEGTGVESLIVPME